MLIIMSDKKFAAFIVTFNRPGYFDGYHSKRCSIETRPPDKLLIVDNNYNDDTKNAAAKLYPQVAHLKVGHNSGFAGGRKHRFKALVKEGYEWILWAADTDPHIQLIRLKSCLTGKPLLKGMLVGRCSRS